MRESHFTFLFLLLICPCVTILAQDDATNNFSYRSFSVTPVGLYIATEPGLAFSADVSLECGKHIFSLGLEAGGELTIWNDSESYLQANLHYGREFFITPKFLIEVYGGAGFLHFQEYGMISSDPLRYGDKYTNTIGVPVGAKFLFLLGPRYSMGVNLHGNFNTVHTIGAIGLVFQWNRKRK